MTFTGHDESTRSDRQVFDDVRLALQTDPRVDASGVGVVVAEGIVTLRGAVPRFDQREDAAWIANQVPGVHRVINDLEVVPPRPATDDDDVLVEEITAAVGTDSEDRVHVAASDGTVILTGTVRSPSERIAIERAARETQGVKKVEDLLIVAP